MYLLREAPFNDISISPIKVSLNLNSKYEIHLTYCSEKKKKKKKSTLRAFILEVNSQNTVLAFQNSNTKKLSPFKMLYLKTFSNY